MTKSTALLAAVLSLASLAPDRPSGEAAPLPARDAPQLKEESIAIEYTASRHEATLLVEAESESALSLVEVRGPDGRPVLRVQAGDGAELSVQGFHVQTLETTPESLRLAYPEGRYAMRAWTSDGRVLSGHADLRHELLPEPTVVYPPAGASGVPTAPTIAWLRDPRAVAYHVVLEQDDNDGLTVQLPGESSSLRVPPGVLAPGKASHVEVGAVGPNGNITLAEVDFTTR